MKGKDSLETKFANAHNYLLLNNTAGCINAYSIAIGSILNDDLDKKCDTIVHGKAIMYAKEYII